jgi:hypothetical protein
METFAKSLRKKEKRLTDKSKQLIQAIWYTQDSTYVGTVKGVGRIDQQTVIDTCSKVAFAKLYDRKNARVASDILNDNLAS